MSAYLSFAIVGIATGCIYALTASGLVVTYTTSGIFNFAHGAIGMVMAFTFWELTVNHGWPQWLGLIVVLGVIAPLFGALIERYLMRSLHGSTIATQVGVTLGLFLVLIALAQTIWDVTEPRVLPEFFAGNSVNLFDVSVTYHQLTMVGTAILVALFLRLLFYRTRVGIAMRAVVDDPELASLNGAAPDRVSATSWAIGSSLAGLAGILLAPLVTLDIILLTLLVINGYAAAMVGRLKSLPWTFGGGLALGLAESFTIGKLPTDLINQIKPALPIIFLYVVLLILPQARLRAGRVVSTSRYSPKVASFRETVVGLVALVAVGFVVSRLLGSGDLSEASKGMVYAMIMLSLVLLVGYAGQTSLAQMSFVGLGSFAMGKWFGGASLKGIVAAAVIAGAVGAIAALPALRLQGLYLALSTLAFAQAMSAIFFKRDEVFGYGGRLAVGRPSFLGLSFEDDRAYFVLICAVFGLMGMGVVAIRRSKFGRKLVAMKDSPAACATLGLNLTFTKLAVFALSSAIAGVAGTFYGGLRGQVGSGDFEMLNSLVILLLVSVAGINTVTGAFFGGATFGILGPLQKLAPSAGNLTFGVSGIGALFLGRFPNGWTAAFSGRFDRVRDAINGTRRSRGAPPAGGTGVVEPSAPEEVRELVGTAR